MPGPIEPGMEALHDPAARGFGEVGATGIGGIFPAWTHMRGIRPLRDHRCGLLPHIPGIQAEILRTIWTRDHYGIEGGGDQLRIMHFRSRYLNGQGKAMPVTQRTALRPVLAAIRRVVSDPVLFGGRGIPERGFGHHSIQALPLPLDAHQFVKLGEPRFSHPLKELRLHPQPKPVIHCGTRSHLVRDRIPLDSRSQHVQYRPQHPSITLRRSPRFAFVLSWRYQRFHSLPQCIAQFLWVGSAHLAGAPFSFFLLFYHNFRITS